MHIDDIDGTPTLLLHGDTLCTDDVEYQRYRQQVRSPAFIADFLRRPLHERKSAIEIMRERSETEKARKVQQSMDIMDVNDEAVRRAFHDAGVTRMIHGHTHRLATHRYDIDGKNCERWVLGDWGPSGNFLECNEAGWRFCRWDRKRATVFDSNAFTTETRHRD